MKEKNYQTKGFERFASMFSSLSVPSICWSFFLSFYLDQIQTCAVIGRCGRVWLFVWCSHWSESTEERLAPGSTVQVYTSSVQHYN